MAVYKLFNDGVFEPEAVEVLARAYEDLLNDLRLIDRNDPFTQAVAREVIEVARTGVRSAAGPRSPAFGNTTVARRSAASASAFAFAVALRASRSRVNCAFAAALRARLSRRCSRRGATSTVLCSRSSP